MYNAHYLEYQPNAEGVQHFLHGKITSLAEKEWMSFADFESVLETLDTSAHDIVDQQLSLPGDTLNLV